MADRKVKEEKATKIPKDILSSEVSVEEVEEDKDWAKNEVAEFTGKYIKAVGRRKRSIARVRLYEGGKGIIIINGMRASLYFPGEGANLISQPLKVTGRHRDFNFSILVSGGGKQGQIGAVRLGISRTLLALDPATKDALKVNDFLTRDPRQVERKKPGLRKARKAPQWSKR
jgi:small subunit ribosomal protein S9